MACLDSSNYDSAVRGMYITTGRFGGKVTVRVDKLGGVGVNSANRIVLYFLHSRLGFCKVLFRFHSFFYLLSFLFCLFWGRLVGMNDDRVVGFRRRMVFSFDFLPIPFCMFYGVAFIFLILPVVLTPRYASCCCFFASFMGWGQRSWSQDRKLGLVLCCVVHTAEYVRQIECLLSILGGERMLECGLGLPLMSGKGDDWKMLSVMTSRLRFFLSRTIGSGKTENGQRKIYPHDNVTK